MAERFIEEVRGDDPELARYVWIEERDIEAGGLNDTRWRVPALCPSEHLEESLSGAMLRLADAP